MSAWADLRDALDLTFRPVGRWPGTPRYDRAYRAAAAKLHPNRGGNHEQFVLLQRAMEILNAGESKP